MLASNTNTINTQPRKPSRHQQQQQHGSRSSSCSRSASGCSLEEQQPHHHHRRNVSLTEAETFFLHGLLIDDDDDGTVEKTDHAKTSTATDRRDDDSGGDSSPTIGGGSSSSSSTPTTKVLNDDVLFRVPVVPPGRKHQKARRPDLLGLWKAYEAGVSTEKLIRKGSLPLKGNNSSSSSYPAVVPPKKRRHRRTASYGRRPPVKSIILEAEDKDVAEATAKNNTKPTGKPPKPPTLRSNAGDVAGEATDIGKNMKQQKKNLVGEEMDKNNSSNNNNNNNNNRHYRRDSSGYSSVEKLEGEVDWSDNDKEYYRRASSGFSSAWSDDIDSEAEVRHEGGSHNGSTWDESDHVEHFDAWEVLKDEYSEDFGFDYSGRGVTIESILDDDDSDAAQKKNNTFRILGTSATDPSSRPHVLSPPLMDALMKHLPQHLHCQNFWLKFSLVRDGASLETLKQYVRASPYTILAIETPNGEVFGSFTSQAWRTQLGYYGSAPAFVWKMKRCRRSTRCHSLFDQAQLESEIDVFPVRDFNALVQVCRHDSLAVGGDDPSPSSCSLSAEKCNISLHAKTNNAMNSGFAIALEDDLLGGTTSPSRTFGNPTLCGPSPDRSQTFEVSGLEVWTVTPCLDVKAAERLEMTKFFLSESANGSSAGVASRRSSSRSSGSSGTAAASLASGSFRPPSSREFTSADLIQDRFYQRVGYDSESQERRDRWQYANMMNATDGASRGIGASPRFCR